MAGSTIAKLFVELGFKDQGMQRGLRSAERSLGRLNSSISRMNSALGGAASKAFYAFTGSITAFAAASAVAGAKFDREMTFVGAVSNATEEDLKALTDQARELGASTMFTATEAATAMQNFARAGMDATTILESTGPALKLAGAAGEDMSLSTQTLAATMAQFSSQAYEAGTVADVFATALTGSLFDLRSLTEAMKYGGTVGANFGMSLEETTAALAQFRNLGLEGSLAGTNFRMAMAHAAKATKKARDVLAKYNLTAKDINPELHSFGEIMETVGAASMSTTDLLEVFGRRAGANIAGIATQFAEGSTTFYELLGDIEGSAGAVESLYQRSTANVLDEFKILKSAFEELLLTVFDQYKGPALQLLKDITSGINSLTAGVQNDTTVIKNSVNELFAYVKSLFLFAEGGAAGAVAEILTYVLELLITFQLLVPLLGDVFRGLTAMFLIGKAVAFAQAVMQLVNTFKILQTAIMAVRGVMLAFMGPAGWAIAAVLAIGAAVYKLSEAWDENKRAIEANKAATESLLKRQQDMEKLRKKAIEANVSATSAWAGNTLLRLEAEGKVDRVYKRELESLAAMSAEEIDRGIAAGQIVETLEDGETVYKSMNLLVQDLGRGFIDEAKSQADINSTIERRRAEQKIQLEAQQYYNGALEKTRKTFSLTSNAQIDSLSATEKEQLQVLKTSMKIGGSWRDWVTGAVQAKEEAARLGKIIEALELTQERAAINTQRFLQALEASDEAALRLGETETETAEEREKRLEAYQKALEAAYKKRIELEEEVQQRHAEAFLSRTALAKRELAKQIQEIKDTYGEEIALYKGNTRKIQELERKQQETIATLRRAATREQYNELLSMVEQATQERIDSVQRTEKEALQQAFAEEVKAAEEQAAFALALAEGDAEQQKLIAYQTAAQIAEIKKQQALNMAEFEKQQSHQVALAVNEIRTGTLGALHTEIQQMEQDLAAALLQAESASEEDRASIREAFAERRAQIVQDTEDNILVFLGRKNADVLKLEQEKAVMLAGITEENEKYRAEIILKYDALIAAARAEASADPDLEDLGPLEKFLRKMAIATAKAFKSLGGTIGFIGKQAREDLEPIDFIMDGLEKGAGKFSKKLEPVGKKLKKIGMVGAVSIAAVGGAIADTDVQAATPLGQTLEAVGTGLFMAGKVGVQATSTITKGAITVTAGLAKVGKAAFKVGQGIAKVAGKMGEMFGKALDGLAALSGFSFSLVDTVGEVNDLMGERAALEEQLASGNLSEEEAERIRAELAEMPANAQEAASDAVTKMVDDAVQMVQVFAESAPVIIATLAEKIPELLLAVAQNLPIIIEALTTHVPSVVFAVIEMIPFVIQALAEGLPDLFQALFALIPSLITALLDAVTQLLPAVGQIIAYFIEQIPYIVFAVLDALPGLIVALVDSLEIIIGAIVEMIPVLIQALAASLPDLLVTLVEMVFELVTFIVGQIPVLVEGIVKALPGLITALLGAIPDIIMKIVNLLPVLLSAIVDAIPTIIKAVIYGLPDIIAAVIAAIPDIVVAIIIALPTIAYELVKAVVELFIIEIPMMAYEFIKRIGRFFADVIAEVISFGKTKTETFGDTPGMQYAGEGARTATFAPGDYFAAATSPIGVLRQAVDAIRAQGVGAATIGRMAGIPGISPASTEIPGLMGLSGAMLSVVDAVSSGPGGQMAPLKVVVQAEGQTLDSVMFTAQKRGQMPNLTRGFSRASGVKVGFDRGKFQFNT